MTDTIVHLTPEMKAVTKPIPMAIRVPLILAFEMSRQIRTAMVPFDPDGEDARGDLSMNENANMRVMFPEQCLTGAEMPWIGDDTRWRLDDWTAMISLDAWVKYQDGATCDGEWDRDPAAMVDIIRDMIERGVAAALVMWGVTPKYDRVEELAKLVASMCVHSRPG